MADEGVYVIQRDPVKELWTWMIESITWSDAAELCMERMRFASAVVTP